MNGIDRRTAIKTAAAGIAFPVGAAQGILATSGARAQAPSGWANRRLIDRLKIEHPIIQAPMGGHVTTDMPAAVSTAGALGSFPTTGLTPAQLRDSVGKIRAKSSKRLNLNFFCNAIPERNEAVESAWLQKLAPYYSELEMDLPKSPASVFMPFGAEMCDTAVDLKPDVVSFHFGLPEKSLVDRIKAAGCMIFSSATTVAEARWLEDNGADAVIAQGLEAGGHRGMFLTTDVASQVGTLALLPQVVDAVKVPVIAAGGIADGRGIAAALALGASAVQMGTAYLLCPEAHITAFHRAALKSAGNSETVITNVLTGRPARVFMIRIVRELGPLATDVPSFPIPGYDLYPLSTKAQSQGSTDFSALYAGQAAALAQELPAGELTSKLAASALEHLKCA
jgi:nitronate monooxygenase